MNLLKCSAAALASALIFASCASTGAQNAGEVKSGGSEQNFLDGGYSLVFPTSYSEYAAQGVFATSETKHGEEADGTPYFHKLYADFMPFEMLEDIEELSQAKGEMEAAEYTARINEIYTSIRAVFVITAYEKTAVAGKEISDVTGFQENTLLGEREGLVYYQSKPPRSEDGLSEQSLTVYRTLYDGVKDVVETIALFEPSVQ